MRITAAAKTETRQRILDAATALFLAEGWHETTTRAIAIAAEIATGTLFNYFPAKEAIAATLVGEALEGSACGDETSLDAALFTLIWSGFARLRAYRKFLGPAAETIFSPLARSSPESAGEAIRVDHLEQVESAIRAHGFPSPLSAVALQRNWTLYLAGYEFWAEDDSPGQEDTLALLDQSLKYYVAFLKGNQ